ncbi:hypothetical protein REPUB_Repub19eG0119400 [Reevesia pubescens]
MDAIEEGYCFMCSPEDSSNNSPQVYGLHKRSLKIGNMVVLLGYKIVFVVLVITILVIYFTVMRKKMGFGRKRKRAQIRVQMNNVPTRWSLAEIKLATMRFHRNKIVGEGASEVVYRGSFPSDGAVAVKRFYQSNRKAFTRNPFTIEFATMVGYLKHKNLVQLQGR